MQQRLLTEQVLLLSIKRVEQTVTVNHKQFELAGFQRDLKQCLISRLNN